MGEEARESFEGELTLRRINRWKLGLVSLAFLLGVTIVFLDVRNVTVRGWHEGISQLGALFGLFSLSAWTFAGLRRKPVRVARMVRIGPGAVRIGEVTIPRDTIRGAQLVPTAGGGLFVRIARWGRLAIDLDVRDKEEGRRVLRALGSDASQSVATFSGNSRAMSHGAGTSFGILLAFGILAMRLASSSTPWTALSMQLGGALLFLGFAATLVPSRIHVGADGILLTWLGTKRFLPLARIREVELATVSGRKSGQIGARVTMEGGAKVWIPVGSAQAVEDRAAALVERIRSAMELHARGATGTAAALLERHDRGVRAWIHELRAIGAGANADLRTAAVSPEQLWRIVESHAAAPKERAAAAVALRTSLDEEGKQRLRVAVETVVDPELRVAVDAALNDDDESLEAALARVTAGPRAGAV